MSKLEEKVKNVRIQVSNACPYGKRESYDLLVCDKKQGKKCQYHFYFKGSKSIYCGREIER